MAEKGDIYQYRLDNLETQELKIELDKNVSARIGLSTREKNYFRIYDDDFAQTDGSDSDNLTDEIAMIINFNSDSQPLSSTIQLGKSFMYESQVAIKIKDITFTNNNFPPGTYLEVRYE